MIPSNRRDSAVGVHTDSDRTVFQCSKTGLLYVFEDPPKRYVSVHSVKLAEIVARPQKVKQHGNATA